VSKPRIGIITRSIDRSRKSGSGHHLAELLAHSVPRAWDLDITLVHYRENDDPIYELAPELIIPENPLAAAARLRKAGFGLIHFSPLTIVSPIHFLPAKKVATIHSAEPMLLPEYYSRTKRLHSRFVIPCYARKLDALITVSETSRAYFAEHYRIPKERVHVTYNACSPAYRRLPASDLTPADKWPYPERYLFHISKFSERKNPWNLLRGYAEFLRRRRAAGARRAGAAAPDAAEPEIKLVLAGSGWDGPEVRSFARELGIEDQLITPGFVGEEEVVELLNRAEAFLFPSYSEGFGMPNLEAMACGCPVVTSSAFAIPEVVGDAALKLKDPADWRGLAELIEKIVNDETLRTELVERGLRRAGSFSWEKSAETLLEVYRSLTAPDGKSG
jgi:glycosyltransferase involved in cell wall biosynthesis